jgi:hypothetical protein
MVHGMVDPLQPSCRLIGLLSTITAPYRHEWGSPPPVARDQSPAVWDLCQ